MSQPSSSGESSPLIPKPVPNNARTNPDLSDSDLDDIDRAKISSGVLNDGGHGTVEEERDYGTLDRTQSALAREQQYEGIPELRKRMYFMFPAMGIGVLMSAADQTLVVASAGRIGSELNALEKVPWIATSYLLTLTSIQPLYGKLSDIFSRKSCLLFTYVIFGGFTLGCGLAQDMNQLITFRALAGIGGAGMNTLVSIILSDVIPLKERGTWQGYINIIYGIGAGAGAPLGGILSDSIGWRWGFLGQVPLCLLAGIAVYFSLKLPEQEQTDWKTKLHRIDYLGALTLVVAVSALLVGLDHGSNASWKDLLAILPVCIAIVLSGVWLFVEFKVSAEPFVPKRILAKRPLLVCYFSNFFQFASYMAGSFYTPMYFQAFQAMSATGAGLLLVPGVLVSVAGSLSAGIIMQKTGKYWLLTVLAFALRSAGTLVSFLCSGPVVTSSWGIVVGHTVGSYGVGITVTTILIGLISNSGREDQAIATSCMYLFRSLGSTIGISLASTLVNQTLRTSLKQALGNGPDAEKIEQGVRRSLAYIKTLNPDLQDLVRKCYGKATSGAFALQFGISILSLLCGLMIVEKPLSAKK